MPHPTAAALRAAVNAMQEIELARAFGMQQTARIAIARAVRDVDPEIRVTLYADGWFAHRAGKLLTDRHGMHIQSPSDSPELCWLRVGRRLLEQHPKEHRHDA